MAKTAIIVAFGMTLATGLDAACTEDRVGTAGNAFDAGGVHEAAAAVQCLSTSDCATINDEVCCLAYSSASKAVTSSCQAVPCATGELQLCETSASCVRGTSCVLAAGTTMRFCIKIDAGSVAEAGAPADADGDAHPVDASAADAPADDAQADGSDAATTSDAGAADSAGGD